MLVVLFILFLVSVVEALPPGFAITQYHHDEWGTGSGIPSDSLRTVIQTKDGYLWIATSGGLARFNGFRFMALNKSKTPELSVENIIALVEDRNGSLWIGTNDGGLLNYNRGKFRVFTINDGLSDNSITALAQDASGRLWIGNPGELCVYENGEFYAHPISHVLSLFADANGVLIGATDGLRIASNDDFTHYPGNPVTAVYRSRRRELWFGARDVGLCKMQQDKSEVVLKTEEIHSILEDRDQNLWFGTREGLQHLSPDRLPHPDIQGAVTSLFEDREGSLWVSTAGDGLHRLKPSPFFHRKLLFGKSPLEQSFDELR